ncbi:MAG: 2-hydroxyacid dehydrogenase [Planctomycetota bacterium]
MSRKPVVAIDIPAGTLKQIMSDATRATLDREFETRWHAADEKLTEDSVAALAQNADAIMTGWGAQKITPKILDAAPGLKVVSHSAGTVKGLVCDELWSRGITVTSCAPEIAIDVAQYTVGLMAVGIKNVLELVPATKAGAWWKRPEHLRPPNDLRGSTVGVISASQVGRNTLRILQAYDVQALLFDPFVSAEQARAMGAEKVELEDLFRRSDLITIHAPSLPATRHMVNAKMLGLMKDHAGLINTSRGTMVDEAALVAELQKGRGVWAILDVTDPEPPPPGSALYSCPNLYLTPHIAGSVGRGRLRLGQAAYEEIRRVLAGEAPKFNVTEKMLATMA